jgi:hypothetical protein
MTVYIYGLRCTLRGDMRYIGKKMNDVSFRLAWSASLTSVGEAPIRPAFLNYLSNPTRLFTL